MAQMQEAERLLMQFQGVFGKPSTEAPAGADERPLSRSRPPATPAQATTLPPQSSGALLQVPSATTGASAAAGRSAPAVSTKDIGSLPSAAAARDAEVSRVGKAPTTLVLRGGSSCCAAYAGIIRRLEEAKMLKSVTALVGTSGGAQVAALLAFGFNSEEIEDALRHTPRRQLLDYAGFPCGACRNFLRLFRHYGVCKGVALEGYFDGLFKKKIGRARCTFQQLYEWSGKELRLGAFNMTTRELEFLDRHSHPDMPVCMATRASSSTPILFRPLRLGKALYVDAGLKGGGAPLAFVPAGQVLALNLLAGRVDGEMHELPPASFVQFLSSSMQALQETAPCGESARGLVRGAQAVSSKSVEVLDVEIGKASGLESTPPPAVFDELSRRGYSALSRYLRPTTE